jgi:hypothetical protein
MKKLIAIILVLILIISCELQFTIVSKSNDIRLNEGEIQKDSIGIDTNLKE